MSHEVLAALNIRSGRVLLGHRSGQREFYPNVWDLFGGHIEPSEQQQTGFGEEPRGKPPALRCGLMP
jgi:8-oxo-dGTP pyrophosphatase MutT (NUDIX family)